MPSSADDWKGSELTCERGILLVQLPALSSLIQHMAHRVRPHDQQLCFVDHVRCNAATGKRSAIVAVNNLAQACLIASCTSMVCMAWAAM